MALRTAVISILAALVLGAVAVVLVVRYGALDIGSLPIRRSQIDRVLAYASRQSIAYHAKRLGPLPAAPPDSLSVGAEHYGEMCVTCHAAPGVDRDEIGKGLNPEPPRLEKIVANWTDAELFWTVKNGIRLTGMPGFGETHTDAEVRSIVAFVRRLPKMSPQEYERRIAATTSHHEMHR